MSSSGDLHRTGTCWDGSGGGHRDALKTGASLLQGQDETIEAARPGEEKRCGDLRAGSLPVPERGL